MRYYSTSGSSQVGFVTPHNRHTRYGPIRFDLRVNCLRVNYPPPETCPDSPMFTQFATLDQPQSAPVVVARPHTVLIIDDDDTLSDVLGHRLKQQGFKTVAAYSGKAGLAKAKAETPSLVLLDLCLPDGDGLRICEQLADASETCSVPIIILSGKEQPGLVRRCRAAGCHYFLRKPYDPNALLVLIRQAIDDAGNWDEDRFGDDE